MHREVNIYAALIGTITKVETPFVNFKTGIEKVKVHFKTLKGVTDWTFDAKRFNQSVGELLKYSDFMYVLERKGLL